MEKDKRKRAGDHGGETEVMIKKGKARQDGGGAETGNDDEVEEFYAIIRRIRVAVKYFENGGRKLMTSPEMGPSLRSHDYNKRVDGSFKRRGIEDDNNNNNNKVGLDLNADPEPDRESA